jgi:mRNA interferase YafQ
MKRNMNMSLIDDCIRMLAAREELAPRFHDHALIGQWAGHRECHIQPDWLLIYRIEGDDLILVLSRTGSNSSLF